MAPSCQLIKALSSQVKFNIPRYFFQIHPECPGELDAALWIIGRKWCFADNPNCFLCPVNNYCEKIATY